MIERIEADPILELRIALTTSDFERMTRFYFDALGIEPAQFSNNGQRQAVVLNLGVATLEFLNETQAQTIDQIEVGKRVSGPIRFVLQVPDLKSATERLLRHGAIMVHPPVITPWGDTNVRFEDPDGMLITLYQKAKKAEEN